MVLEILTLLQSFSADMICHSHIFWFRIHYSFFWSRMENGKLGVSWFEIFIENTTIRIRIYSNLARVITGLKLEWFHQVRKKGRYHSLYLHFYLSPSRSLARSLARCPSLSLSIYLFPYPSLSLFHVPPSHSLLALNFLQAIQNAFSVPLDPFFQVGLWWKRINIFVERLFEHTL